MEFNLNDLEVKDILEADFHEHNIKIYDENNKVILEEITPDIYYDELCVEPKINGGFKSLLNEIEMARNSKVIFVEGYAGCGKSTLVNKIFYEIVGNRQNRNYHYGDYNYKLASSCYNYNYGANTCPDSTDEVNSLIRNTLVQNMINVISKDILDINKPKVYYCFQKLVQNECIVKIDKGRTINNYLAQSDVLEKELKKLIKFRALSTKNLEKILGGQLEKLGTQLLLAADFLWRLAQYIVTSEQSYLYVAYDNLDAIDAPDVLEEFDENLVSFVHNLNGFINDLFSRYKNEYALNIKPKFTIFVTYRKITAVRVNLDNTFKRKSEVVTENGYNEPYIIRKEISDYFDYCEIVKSKTRFFGDIIKKTNLNAAILEKLKLINELNSTKVIRANYKAFWNHNFRGCANIMQSAVLEYQDNINRSIALTKEKCDNANKKTDICLYSGASSIFLRIMCDLFRKGDIFGYKCLNLVPLNQILNNEHTSLSRLILSFFYSRKSESIKELFLLFEGIYPADKIAIELAHLLDKNETWRRPLYYTAYALSNKNLEHEFIEQAKHFENKDSDFIHYTHLKICPCGELYIELIITSFEFFACRCMPDSKPIYCETDFTKVKIIMENVLFAVEGCCRNLEQFRVYFMNIKAIDLDDFLQLPFNATTNNGKKQLHEERIIFNHIAYLESYREFVLEKANLADEDKIEINRFIVEKIFVYLMLYDEYIFKADSQRSDIKEDLFSKAKKIHQSGYTDFNTRIEREKNLYNVVFPDKKNIDIKLNFSI